MAMVDRAPATADSYGIVQGNGGDTDYVAGGSGNDRLQGNAAFNQMYGGAGNDTFILSAKAAYGSDGRSPGAVQGETNVFTDQFAYLTDFHGAGGRVAGENDFIAFSGFGAASTLTLVDNSPSPTSGGRLLQYTLTDSNSGATFNILVNSVNGQTLSAGDFAFY